LTSTQEVDPVPEKLVSITTAAALWGRSVRTIRDYSDRGLIRARRGPGGRRYFSLREILALAPKVEARP
jgi:DNA-binding transcriptional MerR regulator